MKVLDFGLAKLAAPDGAHGAADDLLNSPTMTGTATEAGMILGTASYMAPEQAQGKPVDKRADIWAFGVLLYEMLTGRRPFPGSSTTEVLAGVIKDAPDWTTLPDDMPAALRRLVARCLAKNPTQRLRDIGDARLELDHVVAAVSDVAVRQPRGRRLSVWMLLPAVLTAGLAGAVISCGHAQATAVVGRYGATRRHPDDQSRRRAGDDVSCGGVGGRFAARVRTTP